MITIKATGDTTIYTAGKYCEEDILVQVPSAEQIPAAPVLQNKTIETNGTYTADEGYDGLGEVVVNVPTSNGGSAESNMNTCTVKITVPSSSNYYVQNESVSGGAITYNITRSYTGGTITKTVRCDSVMYISASTIKGVTVSDGELLKLASGYGIAYKTPSTSGITATVTLTA